MIDKRLILFDIRREALFIIRSEALLYVLGLIQL